MPQIYDLDQLTTHRCGPGVMSLPLMERADSILDLVNFLIEFVRGFSSTVWQMSGNLVHIRPRVSFSHQNHPHLYSYVYGRQRPLALDAVPPLNKIMSIRFSTLIPSLTQNITTLLHIV